MKHTVNCWVRRGRTELNQKGRVKIVARGADMHVGQERLCALVISKDLNLFCRAGKMTTVSAEGAYNSRSKFLRCQETAT